LALLVIAAIWLNAVLFTATTANPLVSSDAWYFVDTFVQKALDGTVSIADLFAKRDGFDHAQPLNKLFLLLNARYLGLDFVYEALVGVAFGALGLCVMWKAAALDWSGMRRSFSYYIPLVALAAVYLSLNSSSVFTWSLVAFGYVTYFFILLTALAAWHALSTGSVKWYLPALLACALVADDASYLFAIALAMSLLWFGFLSGQVRRAIRLVAVAVAVSGFYFLWYRWIDSTPATSLPAISQTADRLLGIVGGPEGWRMLIPFSSSVAYAIQLAHWFPAEWETVQIALGLLMIALHAWFWYRASMNRPSAAGFMAISVMLLFYAFVAGIVIGRVADLGPAYFNEPRYVALYQLGVVALLLMALASGAQRPIAAPGGFRGAVVFAVLLIALQFPLSRFSWWEANFNRQYWHAMASQMGGLSLHPDRPASQCVANLVVCEWPQERRARALELLRTYRLNLFSPAFQKRHDMVPY